MKASGQTITYTLVHPASYFADMLTLAAFDPAPVETLNYLPASAASQQHIDRRRPVQDPELHPGPQHHLRAQPRVEGEYGPDPQGLRQQDQGHRDRQRADAIQQQLQTNTAAASMEFDAFPPLARTGPRAQMKQGLNHNFNLGSAVLVEPVDHFQHGVTQQQQRADQGRRSGRR